MKPSRFEYLAPSDLEGALAALSARPGEARPLAGGQSLVPMLNFRLAAPAMLVDLNGIAELAAVETREGGGLALGAMTRQTVLERDPRIASQAPLLAEVAPWIAHAQIRTRGTVGGSVAHADPAAELPAALLVMGARVVVAGAGPAGGAPVERTMPLAEFFLGPFQTALEPEELLTRIDLAAPAAGEGSAFEEFSRRRGDYAIAGVAARVRLAADGRCEEAALALVNATPVPCLIGEVAAALVGRVPGRKEIAEAAEAAAAAAQPATDMHGSAAYRRHLVNVLGRRVLERAVERARASAATGPGGA